MTLKVLCLFPGILESYFKSSIMARAVGQGLLNYELIDIRDYATDRHRSVDDEPYGGGAGMVLKPEPLCAALDAAGSCEARTIYATPSGRLFDQAMAADLAREESLVFIAGRYEGIDQRVVDLYVDDEISIGDYVLSSGEVAVLCMIDGIYRLVDGVISGDSLHEESFCDGLLEYPQYTRPAVFRGLPVPQVLRSGHQARIDAWRTEQRLLKTMKNRPELIGKTDVFRDNLFVRGGE